MKTKPRVEDLCAFIKERHNIYIRRFEERLPPPWTADLILQQYRFCNVYRELDAVTKWITCHWREHHYLDTHLWFALTLSRFINWPPTLRAIGYPVPFNPRKVYGKLSVLRDAGVKVFTGAYLVRSRQGENKMSYVVNTVLPPLWKDRERIESVIHDRTTLLADVHKVLTGYYGVGSFMAAQVIADLKYIKPLSRAADWYVWAASGPGSRRGLCRVYNLPLTQAWRLREHEWFQMLNALREPVNKTLGKFLPEPLHAQDLQNCLCEFDKYERARTGQGRPRNKFKPQEEPFANAS